jgi:hypothetical protein
MSGSGERGAGAGAERLADASSERLCSSELRLEPLFVAAAVERERTAAAAAAVALGSRGLSAVGLVPTAVWREGADGTYARSDAPKRPEICSIMRSDAIGALARSGPSGLESGARPSPCPWRTGSAWSLHPRYQCLRAP